MQLSVVGDNYVVQHINEFINNFSSTCKKIKRVRPTVHDNAGDILYFLTADKSHRKTKNNNELILITGIVYVFKADILYFIPLHCCLKCTKIHQ